MTDDCCPGVLIIKCRSRVFWSDLFLLLPCLAAGDKILFSAGFFCEALLEGGGLVSLRKAEAVSEIWVVNQTS